MTSSHFLHTGDLFTCVACGMQFARLTDAIGHGASEHKPCDFQPYAYAGDPVNHPSHYCSHPSGVECIQITEHMGFCIGNAVKYLWRAGLKDAADPIQDLEKAEWYVHREIARRRSITEMQEDKP